MKKPVPSHIAQEESFDISMDDSMTWDDDTGITPKQNGPTSQPGKVECEYVEMNSPDVVNAAAELGRDSVNHTPVSGNHMASVFEANTDTVIRRKQAELSPSTDDYKRHSSSKERYVEQPGFGEF